MKFLLTFLMSLGAALPTYAGSLTREPDQIYYSFDEVEVILACDHKLSENPNFYVLGRVKDSGVTEPQLFFNIEGNLTLETTAILKWRQRDMIAMDGGYLTYIFDLGNKTLLLENRDGEEVGNESCQTPLSSRKL